MQTLVLGGCRTEEQISVCFFTHAHTHCGLPLWSTSGQDTPNTAIIIAHALNFFEHLRLVVLSVWLEAVKKKTAFGTHRFLTPASPQQRTPTATQQSSCWCSNSFMFLEQTPCPRSLYTPLSSSSSSSSSSSGPQQGNGAQNRRRVN